MPTHYVTSVFCLLALISLASQATLYLSFSNFILLNNWPFTQIFGTLYHKDIARGNWTYLNHFTCRERGDCLEKICTGSWIPKTNEVCLTPVTKGDASTCSREEKLPKSLALLIGILLIIQLLYYPALSLRDGPWAFLGEQSPEKILCTYRFILSFSFTTSLLLIFSTSIFLFTLHSVPFWVWTNQFYQSLNLCLIITALYHQPPIIGDEEISNEQA